MSHWDKFKTSNNDNIYLKITFLHASIYTRAECAGFMEVNSLKCKLCGVRLLTQLILCLKRKCDKSREFVQDYMNSECFKLGHYADIQISIHKIRSITNTAAMEVMNRNKESVSSILYNKLMLTCLPNNRY